MKVLVSHADKQHVNALLIGLLKYDVLNRFYTSFAANKLPPQYFSQKFYQKLQKRFYKEIEPHKIAHFPLVFLLTKLIKSEYWSVKGAYYWYDKWVSKCLKSENFDILIGYENCNLFSFTTAKKRGKTTVLDMASVHHSYQNPVLTAVGTYSPSYNIDYISIQKEKAYKVTDYIFAISTFSEHTLIQGGFSANRIYKTYLGVNHNVFKPKKNYNDLVLNTPLRLYFVGTMSKRKAIPFLLSVFETLHNSGLNIELDLIGPIDDYDATQINIPNCHYTPFLHQDELVKKHHTLDVFVFPSHIDSWAQVVIEAMACGSPVLVSDNTGAKDAVQQGGGCVLPVDNKEAWVEAITRMYLDRQLLKKLGEQAAFVAQQYTWEAYHQQVLAALMDIEAREKKSNNIKLADAVH